MRLHRTSNRTERGAALLVALGALTVLCVGAVACLRASMRLRATRREASVDAALRDLMHAASAPIALFLERDAAQFVLPPDVDDARKTIFDERRVVDGEVRALRIVAFDLYGALSISAAQKFGALARELPTEIADAIDRLDTRATSPVGLDSLLSMGVHLGLDDRDTHRGALSHLSLRTTLAINGASAPATLVASVLALQGKGGIEAVMAARARGELPALPADANETEGSVPALVSRSRSFGFAVTSSVGPSHCTTFATYVDAGGWKQTQRVEVSEGAPHE